MASSYPGPVSAVQVGSYFVGQYYQVLQQQPDLVHQFYSDGSTMIRVDGDSTESANEMLQIHTLILSQYFTSIEIKTINSINSLGGGVLVMVTGSVKSKEFNGRRKFAQTFFLAPQNKGYYVLNDIFQFLEDEVVLQHPSNMISEGQFDIQLNASSPHREPPVSDYVLEEEAREYVNSVDIEDDPVDKYSLPEQQVQQEFETEVVVEETPQEETYASFQSAVNTVQDTPVASVEEPVGEPQKKTWASILRVAKGPSAPEVTQQPSSRSVQTAPDWNHIPQPPVEQSNSASDWSYTPQPTVEAAEESYMPEEEGEMKSVYVRNLPPTVTEGEIEEEFKHFGQIIPDGVFVRARKEIGVCYAFVEFEDMAGVHNALKASPIHLAGRQVYIEERRPNSTGAARGRGRGRGRSSYPIDATRGRFGGRSSGRGSYQDSGDYNRGRGNGFYQRGTR
ncbi:putative nucleotide-binding alpha-beta plait domain, nuclear transport factor 2, NTF2-like protein [Rosa chinensis]|uniref:Putative nucleotide-binding alpha-beta plait domain, nuclear transport factor 2, NTF2-like protein n=1 Tax=Rosa chinensis TaxID=74649 RepID=A0A2P6PUZ4_ROSCH|nr:nuclear transport factor 2 [Rosa chinensis]PRQ25716.1 putative nucleotide-binding alpha-beta plait domain, nuclear transport factor 2, NTF2-like protein [Rosa chinensis]